MLMLVDSVVGPSETRFMQRSGLSHQFRCVEAVNIIAPDRNQQVSTRETRAGTTSRLQEAATHARVSHLLILVFVTLYHTPLYTHTSLPPSFAHLRRSNIFA